MTNFADRLGQVLRRELEGFERLISAERLSGGASQETYRLVATIQGAEQTLALRRAAGGETGDVEGKPGLAIEAKLMQVAKANGVPEPMVHHVLDPADGLGDGFVMEWLEGPTLGARVVRSPDLESVRPKLAYQCGEILAKIHAIDPIETGLAPHLETMSTERFVNEMWDSYKEFDTPQPMIDYTAQWLLANCPDDVTPRLVHNDFRNGNLMITPDGITGVLDWEVAHLGDPMRDLGWICTNSWRFGRRDLPVGGFGHYDDLLAGYESVSGRTIDRDHVHYWEVFGSFWWAIGCLKMADHWRHGPDPSVERPGIARRSSECQVDCVNLLFPGPTALVESPDQSLGSSTDMPTVDELVVSVRDFLRTDVMEATEGRTSFMARVAANSLDIVLRELRLAPSHLAGERERLLALVNIGQTEPGDQATASDVLGLRSQLVDLLRSGVLPLDRPDLIEHLRTTVVNQAGIDQPSYSGFRAAVGGDE